MYIYIQHVIKVCLAVGLNKALRNKEHLALFRRNIVFITLLCTRNDIAFLVVASTRECRQWTCPWAPHLAKSFAYVNTWDMTLLSHFDDYGDVLPPGVASPYRTGDSDDLIGDKSENCRRQRSSIKSYVVPIPE